jgi:signal transduction histidine kinase
MVSWLIYRSQGATSPYYAGLNLMIIVACFLIPYTWLESLFYCSMTLLTYVIACYMHTDTPADNMLLLNNLYFISVTGVICVVACYYLTLKRKEDFQLRHDLAERNAQLADLDRIKSEFFANISHELRTPLTLILAPVDEMLRSGTGLSIAARNSMSLVRTNAMRLLSLINDLLDLVRLEGGTLKLDLKPVDMTSLVRGMVESMRHLADRKEQTIFIDEDYTPVIVMGDANRLEKILLNLLTNALKFTEKAGQIQVTWQLENNQYILKIKDNGIGISPEDLSKIFDRFKQVDSSSTRKYQGLGLGLAMARELSLEHNGSLEVESELGEGSEFILTLPVIPSDQLIKEFDEQTSIDPLESMMREAEQVQFQQSSDIAQTGQLGTGGHKVLVVDDEPDMRSFLVSTLADKYQVHFASDGTSGLKMAIEIKPDLIVLDMMMPGMNGMDVCSAIRQNPHLPNTRVILLTARADERSKIECLSRGADDFLTKPFSTLELQTRVSNLLKTNQLQKDLRESNTELSDALTKLKETESQLLQSEKMNALGSLAAGLLHEVNNPLNYTQVAVQLLQNNADQMSEDDKDSLKDINEGIQRVSQIISDLRDFAYPEQAKHYTPFRIHEAFDSAVRFTSNACEDIKVEQDVSHDLIVFGSKSQLTQVLVNLIQNAVHALNDHAICTNPRIMFKAVQEADYISLLVQDNGCGIPSDKLNRIFDPFYTTRDVGQGMGLGLSICHTIVKNMGGSIQIESQIDTGTTVIIKLPRA